MPIVCLMGPTATGKTNLAIELVQRFPFEIISVDSAMVYRDMNIGTAKPSAKELKKAPHHLIDLCDPATPYSAGRFRKDALTTIKAIRERGNIPLLVGGTLLYFHILQNGVAILPSADKIIRKALLVEAKTIGWPSMHKKLEEIDPDTASQLHPNDSQRIQRALEVYRITGKTISSLQASQTTAASPYRFINIVLTAENRKRLHNRIAKRFELMLTEGFLGEVAQLKDRGDLSAELPSIRTVGYRQAWAYLNGTYDKETMRERAIIATRQLAKRQLTWLRSWNTTSCFDFEDQKIPLQVGTYLQKELFDEHYY